MSVAAIVHLDPHRPTALGVTGPTGLIAIRDWQIAPPWSSRLPYTVAKHAVLGLKWIDREDQSVTPTTGLTRQRVPTARPYLDRDVSDEV